jgi:hypothetical protein
MTDSDGSSTGSGEGTPDTSTVRPPSPSTVPPTTLRRAGSASTVTRTTTSSLRSRRAPSYWSAHVTTPEVEWPTPVEETMEDEVDLDVSEITKLAESARVQLARVATRVTPTRDDLGSYFSEDWVPPTAPGEQVPAEDRPFIRRDTRRGLIAALLIGASAILGVTLVGPRITRERATSPSTTISAPIGVPTSDEDAALLAVQAGTMRLKERNYGNIISGQPRPAESWTLGYLLKADTDTFHLGAPELLNGVSHSHIIGMTRSGALAASWPNNARTREAVKKAINGEFPIELWIDPAGNLVRMDVHTLDAEGGQTGILGIVYTAS